MATPPITILVPSIGRMDFLPITRRCVSEQTRRDFVVKVLDNASPPEAQAFFADWAKSDPRVEVLRVDPRLPMFQNFNRGMRAVETEYVCFFHDDDVYEPRFLEVLAGALDRHPRAAFAGSNNDFIDASGQVTELRRWIKRTELWDHRRYVEELVGRGRNVVPMQGLVFRRDAFGPDGFDESLPIHFGDFVLLMRAAEGRGVAASHESVIQVRRHAGQASAIPMSKSIALRTEVLTEFLDAYAARHPEDAALVRRLRRRMELSHRAGLLWGWMNGKDGTERDACLDALGERRVDAVVRTVLRTADRRGLRPDGAGRALLRVARATASVLRL